MVNTTIMNKIFILLVLSLYIFSSCTKDTSAYLRQSKQEVELDKFDVDSLGSVNGPGELFPGIHLVKLKVVADGVESERRFKYFMPVSINKAKDIALIFNFHGSYGANEDPIAGVSMTHPLSQLAIKENCIVVFPAGEDTGDAVNWQNSEKHLPFVDSMLAYFERHTPSPDRNKIYTCGHSSGAIFSFVLAYERSDVFAAAVPVSGQMKLSSAQIPSRVVPIRAFNGKNDDIVIHSAAVDNINAWASTIGGYFVSDAIGSDTLKIDNYKPYLTTKWLGGRGDIEFYSILDEGHGISWFYIMPMMWDFMQRHPKNMLNTGLYVSSEIKRIDAMEGQTFTSLIKYTDGATISLIAAPPDWTVTYTNNTLTVKAPADFFAPTTINRSGEIQLRADYNGNTTTISIPYTLQAPKAFYQLGDVVYDSNFKPAGVVFWVNPSNIKEAKIIALEHVTRTFGAVGTDFFTPSYTDGYGNTLSLIERVKTENLPLDASTSAFIYAYEYKASPGETNGWYLPAVDELKQLDENLTLVNTALKANGTALEITSSAGSYYLSSTTINDGTVAIPKKVFYTFDYNTNPSWHGYYILANKADNSSYISTRPVKKVTKP